MTRRRRTTRTRWQVDCAALRDERESNGAVAVVASDETDAHFTVVRIYELGKEAGPADVYCFRGVEAGGRYRRDEWELSIGRAWTFETARRKRLADTAND